MLSKNEIKRIKQLHRKKGRRETQLFLVEGEKLVSEAIKSDYVIEELYGLIGCEISLDKMVTVISDKEMQQISQLRHHSPALAIVRSTVQSFHTDSILDEKVLLLDAIRDPGNLGTILRTADWFGIDCILTVNDCVDPFNPKAVQASMGSVFRVQVSVVDVPTLAQFSKDNPSYKFFGAYLQGQPVSILEQNDSGILVIGNEANGISEEIGKLITEKVTIDGAGRAESLNASISASILMHAWA